MSQQCAMLRAVSHSARHPWVLCLTPRVLVSAHCRHSHSHSAVNHLFPSLVQRDVHAKSPSSVDFLAFAQRLSDAHARHARIDQTAPSAGQHATVRSTFPFLSPSASHSTLSHLPTMEPVWLMSASNSDDTGSVSNAARDDDTLKDDDDGGDQHNSDNDDSQSNNNDNDNNNNNNQRGDENDDNGNRDSNSSDRHTLRRAASQSQAFARQFPDEIHAMRQIPYNATASSTVPRIPSLPLVPVNTRPGLPGSIFRWILDPNNNYIRRVLERQLKLGHAYIGLFMYRQGEDIPNDKITLEKPTPEQYRQMLQEHQQQSKAPSQTQPVNHEYDESPVNEYDSSNNGSIDVAPFESALDASTAPSSASSQSSSQLAASAGLPSLSDYTEVNKVYRYGVLAEFRLNGDTVTIMCHRRIEITGLNGSHPSIITVNVKHLDEQGPGVTDAEMSQHNADVAAKRTDPSISPLTPPSLSQQPSMPYSHEIMVFYNVIKSSLTELLSLPDVKKRSTYFQTPHVDLSVPGHLCDYVAALLAVDQQMLQSILSTIDLRDRCYRVLQLVQAERKTMAARARINAQVNIDAQHSSEYLKEQKRSIEKQLGGRDNRSAIVEKLQAKLAGKNLPPAVSRVIDDEMEKLSGGESEGTEFNVTRNYLDWLCSMPYSVYSEEIYDIQRAEDILNADHYALDDVKQRILEFIATSKRAGKEAQKGKIVCLVGPPGTGKTSVAKSIARALGRQFFRFSVGGMDDVAEIKGHRRTYMGALPGKLIQGLKQTQATNPVILIDEIDKIGRGHRGDPAAALLEVLDPEQNESFVDHYLDVPIDLSHVLFVCTANDASTIPGPLADRMEFIHIAGYVWKEKMHIIKHYIEPIIQTNTGVKASQLTLADDAIEDLVRWYCREPGMRNLYRLINKIYSKAALMLARDEAKMLERPVPLPVFNLPITYTVNRENLHQFAGKRIYTTDSMYEATPAGVATGLAWTSKGGSLIFVESTLSDYDVQPRVAMEATTNTNGKSKRKSRKSEESSDAPSNDGGLFTTGQLGDVMKESVSIAYTVAKRTLTAIAPASSFFHSHRIHLHLPSGSTPKDGPSAGITIVASLLSLATQRPLRSSTAMTGELSLTGKVLPVGGIKEKFLAARRSNITRIVLPKDNQKDVDELQSFITEGVEVCYVSSFEEVWPLVSTEPPVELQPIDARETQQPITDANSVVKKRRAPRGKGKQRDSRIEEPPPSPVNHPPADQPTVIVSAA